MTTLDYAACDTGHSHVSVRQAQENEFNVIAKILPTFYFYSIPTAAKRSFKSKAPALGYPLIYLLKHQSAGSDNKCPFSMLAFVQTGVA